MIGLLASYRIHMWLHMWNRNVILGKGFLQVAEVDADPDLLIFFLTNTTSPFSWGIAHPLWSRLLPPFQLLPNFVGQARYIRLGISWGVFPVRLPSDALRRSSQGLAFRGMSMQIHLDSALRIQCVVLFLLGYISTDEGAPWFRILTKVDLL